MKIETKFFGEVEIDETKIATIVDGILGFEEYHDYVLFPHPKDAMFCWLQSTENPNICFLMAEPVQFMFNYSVDVSDEIVAKLQIERAETVATYALVVVPEDPLKISANLAGPIIINTQSHLGAQVISMDKAHAVKHYIIEELKANASFLISNFVSAVSGIRDMEMDVAKQPESQVFTDAMAATTAEAMLQAYGS
ncbi:MAG TPA: flagellar assembly protein FliW [Candidatus Wallbacteria bacterium]|nr:flagellar assembly protein FliW [Candidatus Wallbacteria bacterium]